MVKVTAMSYSCKVVISTIYEINNFYDAIKKFEKEYPNVNYDYLSIKFLNDEDDE